MKKPPTAARYAARVAVAASRGAYAAPANRGNLAATGTVTPAAAFSYAAAGNAVAYARAARGATGAAYRRALRLARVNAARAVRYAAGLTPGTYGYPYPGLTRYGVLPRGSRRPGGTPPAPKPPRA